MTERLPQWMAPTKPSRLEVDMMKDHMRVLVDSPTGTSYLPSQVWFTKLWMCCRQKGIIYALSGEAYQHTPLKDEGSKSFVP